MWAGDRERWVASFSPFPFLHSPTLTNAPPPLPPLPPQDAKDYKQDDGNVIAGTKNATDDDFVTFEEFQLFNIYTCIYAAMFDAFAKIGEWARTRFD